MKENLPQRRNIRLKYYDYSKEGRYFITICIKDRIELLGQIKDINSIELSKEGDIAEKYIKQIVSIYKNIIIDEYVIMPNHIHMIIIIDRQNKENISRIMKQYKRCVSRELGYSIWQKSFYDHIIRNEKEYIKIKEYIQNNIANWKDDKYF